MSSSFEPCCSNAAWSRSSSHERTTDPFRQMPEIWCGSRSNSECSMISNPSRSEEHTSELQSRENLVCRLLLEKKKKKTMCVFLLIKKKNNKITNKINSIV